MLRTKRKWLCMLCALALLVGCARNQDADEQAKIARTINLAADSAATLAYKGIEKTKGKDKALEVAKKIVEELDANVLPVVNNPNAQITAQLEALLMAKLEFLDADYRRALANGFGILEQWYKSPTGNEVLGSEGVLYLQSFFNGLRAASQFYVEEGSKHGLEESRGRPGAADRIRPWAVEPDPWRNRDRRCVHASRIEPREDRGNPLGRDRGLAGQTPLLFRCGGAVLVLPTPALFSGVDAGCGRTAGAGLVAGPGCAALPTPPIATVEDLLFAWRWAFEYGHVLLSIVSIGAGLWAIVKLVREKKIGAAREKAHAVLDKAMDVLIDAIEQQDDGAVKSAVDRKAIATNVKPVIDEKLKAKNLLRKSERGN